MRAKKYENEKEKKRAGGGGKTIEAKTRNIYRMTKKKKMKKNSWRKVSEFEDKKKKYK